MSDFRQYYPGDGVPISEATTAYLSFDDTNLYVVFVCKDDPRKVRARMSKREDIESDDQVVLNLDTFHDRRRAYGFRCNPLGIQLDSIFTEGQGRDDSFDTLWHSEGRLTDDGYIVRMAIPFRSLRFPRTPMQNWGMALARSILRNNEYAHWPYITQRIESRLQQFATLEGPEQISSGRNLQFIPYGFASRARFLDRFSLGGPAFQTDTEVRAGLDAKFVLRDALTLDTALNPDFSQVESDEPQVTVNQRFEVFFPEKRPFFIENAGFFETPVNLFFSRRIADPQLGARLTGKIGPWGIGGIVMDDRAEGKLVPESDPLRGRRAGIGVARIQREFSEQSSIGLLVTSRYFASSSNRVFSFDTRLRLNPNWVLSGQLMRSYTNELDGTRRAGPSYWTELSHNGRHFSYAARYSDRSPDFRSHLGFIPRVDIRQMEHSSGYSWRPDNSRVLSFGPSVNVLFNWNRQGQLQDWAVDAVFGAVLSGPTSMACRRSEAFELFQAREFRKHNTDCAVSTSWLKWLDLLAEYGWGSSVNFYPGPGLAPSLANETYSRLQFTLRPSPGIRFDQTYLYSRLGARLGPSLGGIPEPNSIFNNHILRSKLNYQFTRELSLRAILDYNGVLPNPSLVALERTKRFAADVLLTYLLNPGTALYVGYTDIYENLELEPRVLRHLRRTGPPGTSTGRQFFVKISYLFRL